MAQIRKRGDNSYQIIIFLGRDKEGKKKEHRETFYGKKSEAKRYAEKKEVQMKEKLGSKNIVMTIGELLDLWLDEKKTTVSERTYEKYNYHVRILKTTIGDIFLYGLTPLAMKQALKEGINPKLSNRTQKDIYDTLRTALNAGSLWDLVRDNLMKNVKPPKLQHQERKVLNPNELKIFLETAKQYKHYRILRLLALTGMRISEALGLKWMNVDFESNTIQIVRATNIKKRTLKETKTLTSLRTIGLDQESMDELKNLKKELGNKARPQDLVFQSDDGRPLRYNAVRLTKERVLASSGLRHIRLHDLRHGVGSIMLDKGYSITETANLLGNKPVTLLGTYSEALRYGKSIASLL